MSNNDHSPSSASDNETQGHEQRLSTIADQVTQSETTISNDTNEFEARKRALRGWKIAAVAIIAIVAVAYTYIDFNDPNQATEAKLASIEAFDQRLVACSNVRSAALNEAFENCLSAAEEGNIVAIKRIIWAYSRQGKEQNLTKVFEWLRRVPNRGNATELLMFSLVHLNTDAEQLRKDSEEGISRLVAKNYAPANIVLASIYALGENILAPSSNTLWLLEKAHNKNPIVLEATTLAMIYANGFLGPKKLSVGKTVLEKESERNFPVTTNNTAWFLATLDTNPFTPSDYAVTLAKEVIDDPVHGKNPIYVDTLAATYAANNQFSEAIEAQNQAIDLLKQGEFNENFTDRTLAEYEERLSLYQENRALVETSLITAKEPFFKNMRNRTLEYVLSDFFQPIDIPTLPNSDDASESASNEQ